MKKLIAFAALVLMLGGANGALAAKDDNQGKAGPNGKNDHGLCTAYFNGQKKGHEGGSPRPFEALEQEADKEENGGNADGVGTPQEVYDFCINVDKGIGGNPGENGRFTDCFEDDDEDGTADGDCTVD